MENEKQIYDYAYNLIAKKNKSSEEIIEKIMKKGVDEKEALNIYDNVFAYFSREKDIAERTEKAERYSDLGIAKMDLEDYAEAIDNFNKAIEVKPNFPFFYHLLGHCYFKQKQYEKAISSYKQGLESFDNLTELQKNQIRPAAPFSDSEVYKRIGVAYYELKEYTQSVDYLRKASELDTKDAQTYGLMGNVYEKLEDYIQAIICYQIAKELNPDDTKALFCIGKCYAMLAVKEHSYTFCRESIIYCDRALKSYPNDESLHKIKDAMFAFFRQNAWLDELGTVYSKDKKRLLIGNPDITEYKIIDGCEIINYEAFLDCDKLQQIHIPQSVTTIEPSAFELCEKLQSVYIPDSVTVIEKRAFDNCLELKEIRLSNNITCIEEYTFFHCHALTRINIPSSVTEIGFDAFYRCGLTEIHCHNPNPPIAKYTKQSVKSDNYCFPTTDTSTCILYVPHGAVSAYRHAEIWKDFVNIVEE